MNTYIRARTLTNGNSMPRYDYDAASFAALTAMRNKDEQMWKHIYANAPDKSRLVSRFSELLNSNAMPQLTGAAA